MTLSMLAPLGLVVGLLAVGPILAHLTRRKPQNRQVYGAMLLLRLVQVRLKRRRRVHDLSLIHI